MPEPTQEQGGKKQETVVRTLLVALFVSLVGSSLVASASVLLKPRQVANAVLEQRRNILGVAGLLGSGGQIDELFERIEPRVVDLETGNYVEDVDPGTFDPLEAAKDPDLSIPIPADIDVARVGRRAKHGLAYLVRRDGEVGKIILPISGYGLWALMYGFVALEADGNTIADITFYSHGETPGLGDFVVKPEWRELWRGKRVFDESGQIQIAVVKGRASADDLADYHVDGISGATLTGNGVTNLMRYWLGDHGYGPYLRKIQGGREK